MQDDHVKSRNQYSCRQTAGWIEIGLERTTVGVIFGVAGEQANDKIWMMTLDLWHPSLSALYHVDDLIVEHIFSIEGAWRSHGQDSDSNAIALKDSIGSKDGFEVMQIDKIGTQIRRSQVGMSQELFDHLRILEVTASQTHRFITNESVAAKDKMLAGSIDITEIEVGCSRESLVAHIEDKAILAILQTTLVLDQRLETGETLIAGLIGIEIEWQHLATHVGSA